MNQTISHERIIKTSDGESIAISVYIPPKTRQSNKVLLIAPAVGMPKFFYHKFALFMANNGFQVYTFDCRGVGLSANEHPRTSKASIRDWAVKDLDALISKMREEHPGAKLYYIGHSMGGHLLTMTQQNEVFEKAMFVATPWGKWSEFKRKYKMGFQMRLLMPLLTKIFGYFPAKLFGFYNNLPSGVIEDWSKWAGDKEFSKPYTPSQQRILRITYQIRFLYSQSDELAPLCTIQNFAKHLENAQTDVIELDNIDSHQSDVGHTGFFRPKNCHLWRYPLEFFAR